MEFSSPFLGTFFQCLRVDIYDIEIDSFRPLSWGLSFNSLRVDIYGIEADRVFVPFLGDFLSMKSWIT